jgi:hypothetical protein
LWTLGGAAPIGALCAQAVRTRDVGIASVRYENGLSATAATLNEALVVQRERSSTLANGVLSIFQDGRWGMQGVLAGSRFSAPINPDAEIAPLFRTIRGEASVVGSSAAQQGMMPTFEVLGELKAHMLDINRGIWAGGGVAHTWDGQRWTTAMVGDGAAWIRRGSSLLTLSFRPMQLASGDLLGDTEVRVSWTRGKTGYEFNSGVRGGQARRGTVGWIAGAISQPVWRDLLLSVSAGSYAADLRQALPGGRYASVSMRLPTKRSMSRTETNGARRTAADSILGPAPPSPTGLATTFDTPVPGTGTRVIRVRAAGARRVEIMGDFTDWQAVPMVLGPLNEWELTLSVEAGVHRFNLRVDGRDFLVPVNMGQATDEFAGRVAVVVLP